MDKGAVGLLGGLKLRPAVGGFIEEPIKRLDEPISEPLPQPESYIKQKFELIVL